MKLRETINEEISEEDKKQLAMWVRFAKEDGHRGNAAFVRAAGYAKERWGKSISPNKIKQLTKGLSKGRSKRRNPAQMYFDR